MENTDHSSHRELFAKLLKEAELSQGGNGCMLSKEDHDKIQHLVLREKEGSLSTKEKTMLTKQKAFSSIYKWLKKYTVVTAGDYYMNLVFRKEMDSDDEHTTAPALEEYQVVSHIDRVFDDILHIHQGDHPKGMCRC
jgi:hypothetical protein